MVGDEKNINFNVEDIMVGMGGDNVPEYIQLKNIPNIPEIILFAGESLYFRWTAS